jgi:hypothetical protein
MIKKGTKLIKKGFPVQDFTEGSSYEVKSVNDDGVIVVSDLGYGVSFKPYLWQYFYQPTSEELKYSSKKKELLDFLVWQNKNGYMADFDYEQIADSYIANRKPTAAIEVLTHYQQWRLDVHDDIKYTSKEITNAIDSILEYLYKLN